MTKYLYLIGILLFLGLVACQSPHSTTPTQDTAEQLDTIPLFHARNFSIYQQGGLKIIRIAKAWNGSEEHFEYVLYPKGTKAPAGFENALKIAVPVDKIVCTGTTQIAMLDFLGESERIIGISDGQYLYNEKIRKRVDAGTLPQLGSEDGINYEKLLLLQPELVFVFSIGTNRQHKKMAELGLPAVMVSEFMEDTPLGRAEWLRFMACFVGKEELAKQEFEKIAQSYEHLKDNIAQSLKNKPKPKVFTGHAIQGTWYVAGGASFMAKLIEDAGGDYLWSDNKERGGLPLDFESVFFRAQKADIWLNVILVKSRQLFAQQDSRYKNFKAFQDRQIYNYSARISENGGYDFFESAILQPQIVLADLAKIFYPDLLGSHDLYYYQQLE